MVLDASLATDVGLVRTSNQDRGLAGPVLCAVADGMGGHQGGEVAAQTAVDALEKSFADQGGREGLERAVREANRAVWERSLADESLRGMGTTMTAAAAVTRDGVARLVGVNVGDSRAYLLHNDGLERLTADHTLVAEMVRSGQISASEAAVHPRRHILTRALGVEADVEVDVWELVAEAGMRLVLCSDGLVNEVGEDEITSVLRQAPTAQAAAAALVEAARTNGGSDNITVVVADVREAAPAGAGGTETEASASPPRDAGPDQAGLPSANNPVEDGLATAAAPAPSEPAMPASPPRRRRARGSRTVTLKVVLFVLLLGLVLGGAVAAVVIYNNSSYFVTLQSGRVVIKQGRPTGLLWMHPRTVQKTSLTTATVLRSSLPELRTGVQEPSLAAARHFVRNLAEEYKALPIVPRGTVALPTTTTTTTVGG